MKKEFNINGVWVDIQTLSLPGKYYIQFSAEGYETKKYYYRNAQLAALDMSAIGEGQAITFLSMQIPVAIAA